MTKVFTYLLLLSAALSSCEQTSGYGKPIVEPDKILESLMNFLIYRRDHLRLSENFTALDENGAAIKKDAFLIKVSSGNYMPLRLGSQDSLANYKLYKLGSSANEELRQTLKQWGEHLYELYQMEGKELPGLNFIDLNGTAYNKETTKGKFLVLKCWFIGCIPCVKEMPALNELKKKYESRKDVLFVSLAFDSKQDLEAFLKKTSFDYAIVADQKSYLIEKLKISSFPTHFIINKQGAIVKAVNDYKELTVALNNEVSK